MQTITQPHQSRVTIPTPATETGGVTQQLRGTLTIPPEAQGIILFAHGSGSGRHDVPNQHVARALQAEGQATLLLDLLTPEEAETDNQTRQFRFDIELLSDRLLAATEWLSHQPTTHNLKVGYFGVSTGSAAALKTAAAHPESVQAVVSRGGRPDLAAHALPHLQTPTLLIVGSLDTAVLNLNQLAYGEIVAPKRLEIVPEGTHLSAEPSSSKTVAWLANQWFQTHLTG